MQTDGSFSCSKESATIPYNRPDESNPHLKSSSFQIHAFLYFLIGLPTSGSSTKCFRYFMYVMPVILPHHCPAPTIYGLRVTALKMVTPDILDTTHKAMRRKVSEDHSLKLCRRDVNSYVRYSIDFFSIREEFRQYFLRLSICKQVIWNLANYISSYINCTRMSTKLNCDAKMMHNCTYEQLKAVLSTGKARIYCIKTLVPCICIGVQLQ